MPASGPAIIASNHVGYVDYAFVMLGPPRPRREVAFLARSDFFEQPLVGTALRALRQIPVDAHGDPTGALRAAVAHLEAGGIVGLHPEGTINPSFLPLKGRTGAVRLAQLTGAPLVPTAVWGSQRLLTKWRPPAWPERRIPVRVIYGEPYHPGEGRPAALTLDLMARIRALVEQAFELGEQTDQLVSAGAESARQGPGGLLGDVGAQRLRERLVGHVELVPVAAVQHGAAIAVDAVGELGDEPGLAETGLAGDHGHVRIAALGERPGRVELSPFRPAADEEERVVGAELRRE